MREAPSATDLEAAQKVLGESVDVGLSDRAWRARTHLLTVSLVAIGLVWFGLRVNPNATVLGFTLTGLTDHAVHGALAIAIIYLAVHFVWMAWESFAEWRLRLTGTRVAYITAGTFGNLLCDYPTDPRQSTLANWLRWSVPALGQATASIESLQKWIADQESAMADASKNGDPGATSTVIEAVNSAKIEVAKLRDLIEAVGKTLDSHRIPASLARFEKTFRHFLNSQNIRWLLIDALLRLVVAAIALFLLLT